MRRESGKPGPRSDRIPPDQNATDRRHPLDALNCAEPPARRLRAEVTPCRAVGSTLPKRPAPALYLSGSASRSRSTQALPQRSTVDLLDFKSESSAATLRLHPTSTSRQPPAPTPRPAQAHRWPCPQQCYAAWQPGRAPRTRLAGASPK